MGQDEVDVLQRLLARLLHVELGAGQLGIGEVHGVVHMAHTVDVPEPHLDVGREARHRGADTRRLDKTFGAHFSRIRRVNSSDKSNTACFEGVPRSGGRGGKLCSASFRYIVHERSIRRRRVSSTERITFAGTPAITLPAGICADSRTTAPLATTEPWPITAPLLIVAFIPIRQSAPTVHPWTTAAWPTVTLAPKVAGRPRSTCTTTLSWTFESRPTTIESKSPRSTAPCQTLAPSSTVTSPTSTALGATKIILSLEVYEDVLHVRVEQNRVDSLFQAQPGLLPPEERSLRECDGILVDRNHTGLQALRNRVRLLDVLRPHAGGQSIGRVIRPRDRLVEVVEPEGG